MVRTFSYAWIDHKLSLLDNFAKVSLVTFFEIIMLFAPLCKQKNFERLQDTVQSEGFKEIIKKG